MQDHPGAPGTARQESTRIIVSTNDGGTATQPRAPGHARPLATTAGAPCRDRLSAAPRAPGVDAAPAIAATVPNHHRPSAAPIATVSSPAGQPRLRQVILPRTPATPNALIYSHTHRDTAHTRTAYRRATRYAQSRARANPPLSTWWSGAGGGAQPHHTWHYPCGCDPSPGEADRSLHQVHPAIQGLPHPRSCSTAATGGLRQHPSRAPPRHCGLRRNPAAQLKSVGSVPAPSPFPFPSGRGPGGRSALSPLSTCWRGAGGEAISRYVSTRKT